MTTLLKWKVESLNHILSVSADWNDKFAARTIGEKI